MVRELSAPRESHGARRGWWLLGLGSALLVLPMVLYPGNWSYDGTSSVTQATQWATMAMLVFVLIAMGGVVAFLGWRELVYRAWGAQAPGTIRRAAHDALSTRTARIGMGLAASGYVVLVGVFLSLFGFAGSGAGIFASAYPAGENILCCGPIGETPVAILLLSPTFELVVYPVVVVTVYLATLLFAMNVGVATALVRQRSPGRGMGSASFGATCAVLVNCPTCGTVLIGNIIVGTAAAGLLVTWAAYSIPIMLVSFPASFAAFLWSSRRLAATRRAPPSPHRGPRSGHPREGPVLVP